jgi:trans-aconitate 2-methyltransferase
MWDANQYLKYARERARPFFDLLAQVRNSDVRTAVDLGCGPGELTCVLSERWPAARVLGIDNSPEMLTKAAAHAIPGRLEFVAADLATWKPAQPCDLLFSNAALQWVSDHEQLFARLVGLLAPGGTLAVQMPYHMATPAQQAIDAAAREGPWQPLLAGVGLQPECVLPLLWYVRLLTGLGLVVDAWETTYLHILTGANPVLEWMKGTALRPLLDRLDTGSQEAFLADVGRRLRAAYPAVKDVTLFPFPRIFVVATRP